MAHEIVIPRLGWSMEEGTFVGWTKRDGDLIRRGDTLFELEGEKACQDIEAVDEGILRIPPTGPQPGSLLKVGAVVGYLVEAGEVVPWNATTSVPDLPRAADSVTTPPGAAPSVRRLARQAGIPLTELAGTGPGGRVLSVDVERAGDFRGSRTITGNDRGSEPRISSGKEPFASPRGRRVAAELGVDWRRLEGTGAGGRIRERDVRAAAASGAASNQSDRRVSGAGQRLPLTSRRRLIAQRMVASRQRTVPVTLTTRADATNLVNLREQFKSVGASAVIPSYQDIITKLVAGLLLRHPLLAGRWEEDAIVLPAENEIHLGMAVDTEQGLLVPVIRGVFSLSLADLAERSRTLVAGARSGQLSAAEMQGSVFTITNLGAFGIEAFTPVINLPEAAILGLGAIRREPVVLEDGQIAARHQISLSLTFDHRIVDGAPAARFLQEVAAAIANPSASLLSR